MKHFIRALAFALPWCVLFAGLMILGREVWPLGEARNWLAFLQDGPGAEAARLSWAIDWRNPLSPWWHIFFTRPLFAATPAAFLILQLISGLAVGISAALMADAVTKKKARAFSFGLGIVASVTVASAYLDGVIWPFVCALACSLLSVWAYCNHVQNERRGTLWYTASLLLYFVALGTYTIQAGAVLAVALIAFSSGSTFRERVMLVLRDATPFAILAAIFLLIWRTTSPIPAIAIEPTFSTVTRSIGYSLWHPSYTMWYLWAKQSGASGLILGALGFAATLAAFRLSVPERLDENPGSLKRIGMVLLVGACLLAPTFAVKSAATAWTPGSRTTMMLEFWTPLLACSLLAALLYLAPIGRARTLAWTIGVAVLAALAIMSTRGMNMTQVAKTAIERNFFDALRPIVLADFSSGAAFPRHYLIQTQSGASGPSNEFANTSYTRTEFPALPPLTYRYISSPLGAPTRLLADGASGVASHNSELVPYSQLGFLTWDGVTMRRVEHPTAETFSSPELVWEISAPP